MVISNSDTDLEFDRWMQLLETPHQHPVITVSFTAGQIVKLFVCVQQKPSFPVQKLEGKISIFKKIYFLGGMESDTYTFSYYQPHLIRIWSLQYFNASDWLISGFERREWFSHLSFNLTLVKWKVFLEVFLWKLSPVREKSKGQAAKQWADSL